MIHCIGQAIPLAENKEIEMEILNAEYNDYVVGFVIETNKGNINAQADLKVINNS